MRQINSQHFVAFWSGLGRAHQLRGALGPHTGRNQRHGVFACVYEWWFAVVAPAATNSDQLASVHHDHRHVGTALSALATACDCEQINCDCDSHWP